jgi:hypothetical protein
MIIIPPVSITTTMLSTSNVPDTVRIPELKAGGTMTPGASPVGTFVINDSTFTFVGSRTTTYEVGSGASPTGNCLLICQAVQADIPAIMAATYSSVTNAVTFSCALIGSAGDTVVFTEAATAVTITPGTGTLTTGTNPVDGDYLEWSSASTYYVGEQVVITSEHTVYEALRTTVNDPPASSTADWAAAGPTNRWAMFDLLNTTVTTQPESIIVSIVPGSINSAYCLNCMAASIQFVLNDVGGDGIVYDETITPASSTTTGNYGFHDLPTGYDTATLTITISNPGSIAQCGFLVVGTGEDIGRTMFGSSVELIDYTRKDTDTNTGYITLTEGPWARRGSFQVVVTDRDGVRSFLSQHRATPILCVGNDTITDGNMTILSIYGIIKSDEMSIGVDVDSLPLDIEGLI